MAGIGNTFKSAVMKSMEAIGSAASSLASSTQFRVAEMNLSNQRKEILDGFGQKAYQLWQEGASFPPELEEQLKQVSFITEQLKQMRSERTNMLSTQEQVPTLQLDEVKEVKAEEVAIVSEPESEPELILHGEEKQATAEEVPSLVLPQERVQSALEEMQQVVEEQTKQVSKAGEAAAKAIDELVNPPENP